MPVREGGPAAGTRPAPLGAASTPLATDLDTLAFRCADELEASLAFFDRPVCDRLHDRAAALRPSDPIARARLSAARAGYEIYELRTAEAARRVARGFAELARLSPERRGLPEALQARSLLMKRRGECCLREPNPSGALRCYRDATQSALRLAMIPGWTRLGLGIAGGCEHRLAQVHLMRSDETRAAAAFGRAITALSEAVEGDAAFAPALADRALAFMDLADVQLRLNGVADALVSYDGALVSIDRTRQIVPTAGRNHHSRARVLANRGYALGRMGRYREGLEDLAGAGREFDRAIELLGKSPAVLANRARARALEARLFAAATDLRGARRRFAVAERLLAEVVERHPEETEPAALWSAIEIAHARALRDAGALGGARALVGRAMERLDRLRRSAPTHLRARQLLVDALCEWVRCAPDGKEPDGVPDSILTAAELATELVRRGPRDVEAQLRRARVLRATATRARGSGRRAQEREAADAALAEYRRALGRWPRDIDLLLETVELLLEDPVSPFPDPYRALDPPTATACEELLRRADAACPGHLPALRLRLRLAARSDGGPDPGRRAAWTAALRTAVRGTAVRPGEGGAKLPL